MNKTVRQAIEKVLEYLYEDEAKHYAECECRKGHIFLQLKILEKFIRGVK
jgi:hypothetical protein